MDDAVTKSIQHDTLDYSISVPWVVLATFMTSFALGIIILYCIFDFIFTIVWARSRGPRLILDRDEIRDEAIDEIFDINNINTWRIGCSLPAPSDDFYGRSIDHGSPSYYDPRDLWTPSSRERDLEFQSQQEAGRNAIEKVSTERETYSAILKSIARLENGTPFNPCQNYSINETKLTSTLSPPRFNIFSCSFQRTHSRPRTDRLKYIDASRARATPTDFPAAAITQVLQQYIPHTSRLQVSLALHIPRSSYATLPGLTDVLSRHRRYHDKPEACPHCPRDFGTTKDLNRHINDIHERTKVFYCLETTCKRSRVMRGKGFPRKDNWRRHMKDAHGIDVN
ncbi:uncharacterized protein PAC_09833 [Phialocephala subalpina]|uniref:C2H2-type domain-containing protein n=1 Tax=Phialocephala subalpina TaxID=576137 RepID=A0A1L7X4I1_9HELO|nr:uncharacterized protein PAC_09833 [Phialocephala subalpina]